MRQLIAENGRCLKYNDILMYCNDCYPVWQAEQNSRWIAKQEEIKQAYSKKSHDTYVSVCGDPIVTETFH